MDFGEVLTSAWRIIWKHKVLWIFGILAGFARGGGGTGGGGGGGRGWQQGRPFGPYASQEIDRFAARVGAWITDNLWIVVLLILLLLVLAALMIFLGTIGRIGLIRGTFKADGGAERLSLGELFKESRHYFWRVFGLSIVVALIFLAIFAPAALFGALTAGVGFLCLLPLLCILLPLMWAAGMVVQQANAAMVIEDLRLMDGVRRGWEVVKKNVGSVIVIWLITAVIGFGIGLIIVLPVLITVIPVVIGFAMSGARPSTTWWIVGGICLATYLPVLLIVNGILTAYLESVWALTFIRLTHPKEGNQKPAALAANA